VKSHPFLEVGMGLMEHAQWLQLLCLLPLGLIVWHAVQARKALRQ
jgi:hypothetical protein